MYNHGIRAIADYQPTITEDCMPLVSAFSTAQNLLFTALLDKLRAIDCRPLATSLASGM